MADGEAIPRQADAALLALRFPALDARWTMFGALVVLNVLDVVTTAMVIGRGGIEGNPVMQSVVDNMLHVGVLKAVVLALIAGLLSRSSDSKIVAFGVTAAAAWYLAVVSWNVVVLTAV